MFFINRSTTEQYISTRVNGEKAERREEEEIKVMKLMFDDSRKSDKQNYEEVYSVYDFGVDEFKGKRRDERFLIKSLSKL